MSTRAFAGLWAAVVLLGMVGCTAVQKPTNVQKGALIGGGGGAAVGASAGHFMSAGSGPGALIGLGLGAATGAVVADRYYPDDDPSDLSVDNSDEIDLLSSEIAARDAELASKRRAIAARDRALLDSEARRLRAEKERQAALEALELARDKPILTVPARAPAGFPEEVTTTRLPGGGVKLLVRSEILFSSGKAKVGPKGRQILAKVADTIRLGYANHLIEVRGHTDNVPIRYAKFASNQALSLARAQAVADQLAAAGFSRDRILTVGMADTAPIDTNDTPQGRRLNRRAEIYVRPRKVAAAE